MPTVKRVPQRVLASMWRQQAEEYYQAWVEEIGKEAADKYIDTVTKEIIGLFSGLNMKVLYVANDTGTRIRQESITAHELAHYLQQRVRGKAYEGEHWIREMQAGMYQDDYVKEFCPKCNEFGVIKEAVNE